MDEKEAIVAEAAGEIQITEEEYRYFTVPYIMAQGVVGAQLQNSAITLNEIANRERGCSIVSKIIGRHGPKKYSSAIGKLQKKGRPCTLEGASTLNDIAGLRVIVAYEDDIQTVVDEILDLYPDAEVKNFLPEGKKLSGYRGIHVIVMAKIVVDNEILYIPVEIQVMTPLMSDWSLRQHDDYKGLTADKEIGAFFRKLSKHYVEIEKIRMALREYGVFLVNKNDEDFHVYYSD